MLSHHEAIANILADAQEDFGGTSAPPEEVIDAITQHLAAYLGKGNPVFGREKFLDAAGYDDGEDEEE